MIEEKTKKPLISVISITLNDEEGLSRTIRSLKSQVNMQDYEHIVVDGVSDYNVGGLLTDLGSQACLHQGQDSGLYDAMNRGTELASGSYLLYLNSGDTFACPEVLASIAQVLINERPDFFWGDSLERQLDGEIRYKPSRPMKRLPFGMISHHQAMLFSRDVIEKHVIRYDLTYLIAADYDFVLRHVSASKAIHYLPEPVCIFERGGISYQKSSVARCEQFLIRRATYGSVVFAAAVFAGQWALHSLRSLSPTFYWQLRKRFG